MSRKHDPRPGAERAFKRAHDIVDSASAALRATREKYPLTEDIELCSYVAGMLLGEFPSEAALATVGAVAILKLEQKERAEQADAKA